MGLAGNGGNLKVAARAGYAAAVLISVLFVPFLATGEPPNVLAAAIGLAIAGASTWKFNQWSSPWPKELAELGAAAAVIGTIWIFVFSMPTAVLWFAPAWLMLSALVRIITWVAAADLNFIGNFASQGSGTLARLLGSAIRAGTRFAPAVAPFLTSIVPVVLTYVVLAVELPGFALPDHHTLAAGSIVWLIVWAVLCAFRPTWLASASATLLPLATAALLVGLLGGFGTSWVVWTFWSAAFVVAYQVASWRRGSGQSYRESVRLLVVIAGAGALMKGFLSRATLGAGDARWYATMLQDMILQTRAHGFPVWSGQTPYQFNGAIYPLRVAPSFHHLGALLDLATAHILGVVGLMNLLIFVVGITAALAAYYSLCVVTVERRWAAALLALIYLACPGVLGVAYNTDLYMSWMTIPFVPVAFAAVYANFNAPRRIPTLVLAAALGLCWWGHSPIALWTTAAVTPVQLGGLSLHKPDRAGWINLGLGAALFLAIAAYPVGSVLAYPPEPGVNAANFQRALPGNISNFLHEVFPQVLLPLSPRPQVLSNFQLGYSLWILLFVGLALVRRGLDRRAADILGVSLGLAVLLTPCPGTHDGLWTFVPAFFRNTTGNWVMNRLYVVLAGSIVVAAAVLLRSLPAKTFRVAFCLLVLATAWSLGEASKFSPLLPTQLGGAEKSAALLRPENIMVTRFAYLVFPAPPATFSDGVVAPELEYRLLDRSTLSPLSDGISAAAAAGHPVANYDLTNSYDPEWLGIGSPMHLAAGHRYLMKVELGAGEARPVGVLQLKGPSLFRENLLPAYGGDLAFGYGDQHTPYLPVWTSLPRGEDTRVIFVPQDMTPAQADHFASLSLIEYDPGLVPVQVTNWMPSQASIHADAPAWFESPRAYQVGYVATVDGAAAVVRKSPLGLTMVAVPKGHSTLVLKYEAPLGLQALFYSSVLAIALSLGMGAWLLARKRPALSAT